MMYPIGGPINPEIMVRVMKDIGIACLHYAVIVSVIKAICKGGRKYGK